MKLMSLLFVLLVSMFMVSCQSLAGTELRFLPLAIGVFGFIFLIIAFVGSKSNSDQQTPGGGPTRDNTGNVPIYKSGYFVLGAILIVISIIVYFWIKGSYKGVDLSNDVSMLFI